MIHSVSKLQQLFERLPSDILDGDLSSLIVDSVQAECLQGSINNDHSQLTSEVLQTCQLAYLLGELIQRSGYSEQSKPLTKHI